MTNCEKKMLCSSKSCPHISEGDFWMFCYLGYHDWLLCGNTRTFSGWITVDSRLILGHAHFNLVCLPTHPMMLETAQPYTNLQYKPIQKLYWCCTISHCWPKAERKIICLYMSDSFTKTRLRTTLYKFNLDLFKIYT